MPNNLNVCLGPSVFIEQSGFQWAGDKCSHPRPSSLPEIVSKRRAWENLSVRVEGRQ